MKRMKKTALTAVLSVAFLAGFLIFSKQESDASKVKYQVMASNEIVKRGEEITVSFTVTGDAPMKTVDAYLYYDASVLEFVKADKDAFIGTAGVLKLADTLSEEADKVTYQLRFKALNVGTSEFRVQEMHVEDEANTSVFTANDVKVMIKAEENMSANTDASLKSLEVFPETLSPAFSKSFFSYEMSVDGDRNSIILSAVPEDSKSTVEITGNENLKRGENKVVIVVTSVSGVTKEYVINVNKQ